MSKELVTNDELAFLAKKNKEMAVEEFLTTAVQSKILTDWEQAVQGLNQEAQVIALDRQAFESAQTLTEDLTGDVMVVSFVSKNQKGSHLAIVPTSSAAGLDTEAVQTKLIELMTTLYAQMNSTVEIESKEVGTGKLSELEIAQTFDLNQLVEGKQFTIQMDQTAFNVWMLSDLVFIEEAYKNMAIQVENEQSMPKSSAVSTMIVNEDIPTQEIYRPAFQTLTETVSQEKMSDLNLLADVSLDIYAVLGHTKCSIQELLELNVGTVVELDKLVDEPIEIYANNKQIAEGELVVIDENFGVKLTKLMK